MRTLYSAFIKNVIYPLYQIYSGHNYLKQYEELKRTQWLSKDEIIGLQWSKLKQLLEHTYNNVPYYKRVFDCLFLHPNNINSESDFRKLPLLDKETITNNLNDFIASNFHKKDLIKDSTGGSTGVNLQFYYDYKNVEQRRAVELRSNSWAGLDIGDKYTKLWGSHFDIQFGKKLRGKMSDLLFRQLFLSSYNLSDDAMREYATKILHYKPKCIVGYSSSLYIFAKFLHENKIDGIKPKSIISSAEVLHDYQRELIESVFGCKVFDRYGCREFSTIAQECERHTGLHINLEHVFVEILDEKKNPCDPGEKGEIVITDLDNYAFPFIRYRIGDMGAFSPKKCPCGRGLPLLENIDGRVWDVIIGINGNRIIGSFWLIKDIKGIEQFQILQEEFGKITVKLIINNSFTENEKKKLLNRIFERCGKNMKVDILLMDNIPVSTSGKHKFIISKVSPFCKAIEREK